MGGCVGRCGFIWPRCREHLWLAQKAWCVGCCHSEENLSGFQLARVWVAIIVSLAFVRSYFFCRWLRRPVLSWTEVPVFPSPRAVQPIQPAESPPHGQNYSLTPTAPLPPPSLPPFLQTCFSFETTGMGTGRGERLTKGKKRLKPERRIE